MIDGEGYFARLLDDGRRDGCRAAGGVPPEFGQQVEADAVLAGTELGAPGANEAVERVAGVHPPVADLAGFAPADQSRAPIGIPVGIVASGWLFIEIAAENDGGGVFRPPVQPGCGLHPRVRAIAGEVVDGGDQLTPAAGTVVAAEDGESADVDLVA